MRPIKGTLEMLPLRLPLYIAQTVLPGCSMLSSQIVQKKLSVVPTKQKSKKTLAPIDEPEVDDTSTGAMIEFNGHSAVMLSVVRDTEWQWAVVDQGDNRRFEVSLAFRNSQCTTCEIRLSPNTEKGVEDSKGNFFVGCVVESAKDSLACEIGSGEENVYYLSAGDWFMIPRNTTYNLKNISSKFTGRVVLNIVGDLG